MGQWKINYVSVSGSQYCFIGSVVHSLFMSLSKEETSSLFYSTRKSFIIDQQVLILFGGYLNPVEGGVKCKIIKRIQVIMFHPLKECTTIGNLWVKNVLCAKPKNGVLKSGIIIMYPDEF